MGIPGGVRVFRRGSDFYGRRFDGVSAGFQMVPEASGRFGGLQKRLQRELQTRF